MSSDNRSVTSQLKMLWFVFLLYIRQSFHHKSSAVGVAVTWIVRVTLTIILYHYIYQVMQKDHIQNITLSVAISGMVFYTVFMASGYRELARLINAENRTGNLEIWFNKPLSYNYLKIAECFGRNIVASLVVLTVGVSYCVYVACDMHIDRMGLRLFCGFLMLLGGLAMAVMFYLMIGLAAVFLGNTRAIENTISKFIMVFGGAYVPIGFFPGWFRFVGELLPTSAMTYGGQMLYPDFIAHLPRFLLLQAVWICIMGMGLFMMNRKVRFHLNVNGG